MQDDSARLARKPHGAHHIAPDCAGMDFWQADASFRSLLTLYMPPDWRERMTPHFARLGARSYNTKRFGCGRFAS